MSNKSFVPKEFILPKILETPEFKLRMLRITDVVKDYDAVMTSIDHLKGVFGKFSSWPSKDLTFEQDLIDLGWHHKEFQRRNSFAYTVMNKDESQCLGCMYIYPTTKKDFDAEVYMWIRESDYKRLDSELFNTVKTWIQEMWPFKKVAYPGRDIDWRAWEKL